MAIDLDAALADLAESLEFPGSADLAERVMAELSAPAPVIPLRRRPVVRRAAALLAAAVVVIGVALVASPRARDAVADLLGIGSVEIRTSSREPEGTTGATSAAPPATAPVTFDAGALGLGEPVAAEAGATTLGVPAPIPPSLGPPAAAYVGDGHPASDVAVPRLTYVWPVGPNLSPTSIPGVGALLTVLPGRADEGLVQKILEPGTTYERLSVNGRPAIWLAGEPHQFLFVAPDGSVQQETLRLAGNTLLWIAGGRTYRLESALDRDAAVALAEDVPLT